MTRFMVPKADNEDDLESLTYHYCNNYEDTLPIRTKFVTELMEATSEDFNETCMDLLLNTENINMWYDPMRPNGVYK